MQRKIVVHLIDKKTLSYGSCLDITAIGIVEIGIGKINFCRFRKNVVTFGRVMQDIKDLSPLQVIDVLIERISVDLYLLGKLGDIEFIRLR